MSTRLVLHGDYDVWRRDELQAQLDALDPSGDVVIDAAGVTLLDAGCAGLLILFQRRLRERNPNARIAIANAPRIVRRVLELCGAAALFEFTNDR